MQCLVKVLRIQPHSWQYEYSIDDEGDAWWKSDGTKYGNTESARIGKNWTACTEGSEGSWKGSEVGFEAEFEVVFEVVFETDSETDSSLNCLFCKTV